MSTAPTAEATDSMTDDSSLASPGRRSASVAAPGSGAATSDERHLPWDELHTEHGDTVIADTVVQKLAVLASRGVPGVHALGTATGRAVDRLAGRVAGQSLAGSTGVSVRRTDHAVSVAVSVVVEAGVSIPQCAATLRRSLSEAIEYGTGLTVTAVDVDVTDLHLPEDEAPSGG